MYKNRIYRALFSLIIGVAILLGSTGFVIQTHECQYTGSKVYVLAGDHKPENKCCDHGEFKCCEVVTDGQRPDSCGNKDLLRSEPCCKHEIDLVQLPGFTISDKNTEKDVPLIAESLTFVPVPEINRTDIYIYLPYHNKHGGKEILILNCQSLT